jgi:hypothetical protein
MRTSNCLISVDALIHPEDPQQQHTQPHHEGGGELHVELAFALLAPLGAPRK